MSALTSALVGNQTNPQTSPGSNQVPTQVVSNTQRSPQTDENVSTDQPLGDFDLPTQVKLDLALKAIEEAGKTQKEVDQVVAQPVISQLASEPPSPQVGVRGGKERGAAVSPDVQVVDAAGSLASVEYEPTPEIPPEVEEYIKRVEEHADTLSEPIVVDGQQVGQVSHHHPTQPVVVLPITEEDEKKARFKSPRYSIRWLVEWSHKIIKKFVGKVVYRMEQTA